MTSPENNYSQSPLVEQGPAPADLLMVQELMAREGGEAALRARMGLGIEELAQRVQYGSFIGTLYEAVSQTLPDGSVNKCPIGGILQAAYEENGLPGVKLELDTMSRQARSRIDENGIEIKNFSIALSRKTLSQNSPSIQQNSPPEQLKKN